MVFPLLMIMSIVALIRIAIKQRDTDNKLKRIEKVLKYYIDGKEDQNKKTEGTTGNDTGGD